MPKVLTPPAPELLGRGQAPQAGRLVLGPQALVVGLGQIRGVRVELLFERNNLFADKAPNLIPEQAQLGGEAEALECFHVATSEERSADR